MLSFALRGGQEETNPFIRSLKLMEFMPFLGDVTTTVSPSVLASHRIMSVVQCEQLGITENVVRVSIGVEDVDDILADLGQALEQIL